MTIEPTELMQLAIRAARLGIAAGQSPFGCAIARGDAIIAVAHNHVVEWIDITAHAEISAIRSACQQLGNIHLTGCTVASTCEPCPMCMSALHWARVQTVYFGASIHDAQLAGFNELRLAADQLLSLGGSSIQLVPGLLADECRKLFLEWQASPSRQAY